MTQTVDPATAEPSATGGPDDVARRRGSPTRCRVGLVLILLGGVIVGCFAWLLITVVMARGELQQVHGDLRTLRTQVLAGDFAAARSTAGRITAHAAHAHGLTTGPVWAAAARMPGAEPVRTVRTLTMQVDRVAHDTVPELVAAGAQLDPAHLRRADGGVDLGRIAAAAPALEHALVHIGASRTAIAAQPSRSWLPQVDAARADMLGQLTEVQHTLRSADIAARVVPPLLGGQGVRRYFVAFQNEAEARGTGGIPGAFAILRADHGNLAFDRFESDSALYRTPVTMNFGTGYANLFRGTASTDLYVNANLSPHFPYAAQTWAAMWQRRSGQRVDGVVAVDPIMLSYLLKVAGPARMSDGTVVSAGNVIQLTQSAVYARFPHPDQNPERKQYLLDIARGVSQRVLTTDADASRLVRAGATAAGQRRLLVYSADPALERLLAQTSLSGVIPQTRRPYAGLSIVNDGGNKLDYYLDRSLTWKSSGCGPTRDVFVTVRLHNSAPATRLSPYVTSRTDDHSYPVRPGDNREEISYYATSGAVLQSVSTNGRQGSAEAGVDRGHPVFRLEVEVPRARTTTVVLHLREPTGASRPLVLKQPLIHPLQVRIDAARCD